jgi:hypothetical protein
LNNFRSPLSKEKDLKRILEINAAKAHQIEVMNIITKETKIYSSLRQAEIELGISRKTIARYIKNEKEYKNYKFTLKTK